MRQGHVHGSLDGGVGIKFRWIDILPDARVHSGQIQGDQDLPSGGVGQPFAGCLDPQRAVELQGNVSGAGLREQRIAPHPSRQFQQGAEVVVHRNALDHALFHAARSLKAALAAFPESPAVPESAWTAPARFAQTL